MKNWHIVLILAALLIACFLSQSYGIEKKENIYKDYDENDLYRFASHYRIRQLEEYALRNSSPSQVLDYYGYDEIKEALISEGWLYDMCIDEYAE